MPSMSTKQGGIFRSVDDCFVKVDGSWRRGHTAYVKVGGSWMLAHRIARPAPPPPVLEVTNSNNLNFNVKVRMAKAEHMPEIFRIRVLVSTDGAYPSGPFDSAHYRHEDILGDEDWSEWRYNINGSINPDGSIREGSFAGRTTNYSSEKTYADTLPYQGGTKLKPNTVYKFAAWAQDIYGQWSGISPTEVRTGDKYGTGSDADEAMRTRVYAVPREIGTLITPYGVVDNGDGRVSDNFPQEIARFNYGNDVVRNVRAGATYNYVRVLLSRSATDDGPPVASVYGSWFEGTAPTALHMPEFFRNVENLNASQLGKGESRWFQVPQSWWPYLTNKRFMGFHLHMTVANSVAARAVYPGLATVGNQGTFEMSFRS